ncbi:MAG: prolipoprotein diacylglyceryl transferase [Bacteroidaceae bacterium]|nr:prolipoprotein diacylglyceryl transferase [Bacteroidaceae bacterium]
MLAYIDWQPSLELFSIGSFSVRWYSMMWVIGLLSAYLIVQRLYRQQQIPEEKFDPLFIYCFLGTLIGARLGHCIFYEPGYYLTSRIGFMEMFLPMHYTPEGWHFTGYEGLASHGGTIGLFIGMWLYARKHGVGMWTVIDNVAIATPLTCCCIRLGNLMNSEIIGKVTDVPWAFIFHTHEALVDGQLTPRHPAQLYEAIAYLIIFFFGLWIYHWDTNRSQNRTTAKPQNRTSLVGTSFYFGYCVFTIFFFRFFVEFLKKEQVAFEQGMPLDMGQLLSIPFVLIAAYAMWKGWERGRQTAKPYNHITA